MEEMNVELCWNKNKKMSSFKSNENVHKKDGSYYVVPANKTSSVTL